MKDILRKLEITPGGILLLSLLVFLLDGRVLLILLGNVFIHEWGHIEMLRRCGIYIRKVVLSATGLCICCDTSYLSRRGMFICAAAGPMAGLAVAVIVSIVGNLLSNDTVWMFAGTGVILSCFNLLPAAPLDGYRMLQAVAPRISPMIGLLTSVCVLICGLLLMYRGYGTGFALMGIFLVMRDARRQKHRLHWLG